MIKFFRKIRHGLLAENKISKYLIYAIGEIALVVIGILIALQVNNWNEWRKDRIKEKQILEELSETLTKNCEVLDMSLQSAADRNNSRDIIISVFAEKPPFTDSLKEPIFVSSFGYVITPFSYAGYEMLKNEGYDILNSAILRKEIVNIFEITFRYMEDYEKEKRSDVYVEDVARYLIKNFTRRNTPIDYQSFLSSHIYLENIRAMKAHENWLIGERIKTLEETQRVLRLIRDELGKSD